MIFHRFSLCFLSQSISKFKKKKKELITQGKIFECTLVKDRSNSCTRACTIFLCVSTYTANDDIPLD